MNLPYSRTAEQQNSRTAEQQNSRTAEQQNSRFSLNFQNLKIPLLMGIFILLLASCVKDTATKELTTENAQLETRATDCMPPTGNGCTSKYQLWSVTNPLFPGCDFLIGVNITTCTGVNSVYFTDFEIVSHRCAAYTSYINNCQANGTLSICMHQINVGFQDALAIKVLSSQIFQPTGNQVSIQYYFASCSKYCFYNDYDEETSVSFLNYKKLQCTDGCCIRTAIYSNFFGSWSKTSSTTTQISGSGCEFTVLTPPCPLNTFWTSDCLAECVN